MPRYRAAAVPESVEQGKLEGVPFLVDSFLQHHVAAVKRRVQVAAAADDETVERSGVERVTGAEAHAAPTGPPDREVMKGKRNEARMLRGRKTDERALGARHQSPK